MVTGEAYICMTTTSIKGEIKQDLLELKKSLDDFDSVINDMGLWDKMGRWDGVKKVYSGLYAQNIKLVQEKEELLNKISYYEKTYGK